MKGLSIFLWIAAAVFVAWSSCSAQDGAVNGYTYIAPSYYPVPPIVVYDPAFVVPTRTVIGAWQYTPPPPVYYAEPPFVTQTTVPYNPTWNYPPVMAPAPMTIRERARVNRNGLDYKYRAYVPGRSGPVYSYEVDSERHGVKVRERYR